MAFHQSGQLAIDIPSMRLARNFFRNCSPDSFPHATAFSKISCTRKRIRARSLSSPPENLFFRLLYRVSGGGGEKYASQEYRVRFCISPASLPSNYRLQLREIHAHPTLTSVASPAASRCRPAPPSPRCGPSRWKRICRPDKGLRTPDEWRWSAAPATSNWRATPGCCSRAPPAERTAADRRWSPPRTVWRRNWSTCWRSCSCEPCPVGLSRIKQTLARGSSKRIAEFSRCDFVGRSRRRRRDERGW